MKLRRLHVRRMPGIHEGFVVDGVQDGLTLVLGGNGAGKSTLCRALAALLWPGLERDDAVSVEATFEEGPLVWFARREGAQTTWQRDGRDHAAPVYPRDAAARCFTLRFGDLLLPGDPTDETVAREVRRELAGGFDLQQVSRSAFELPARHGRADEARLRERSSEVQRIRAAQAELARREDERRSLERRLDEAQTAAVRLPELLEAAALVRTRARLRKIEAELSGFPSGLERLRGDERERLRELELERARVLREITGCRVEIDATSRRIDALRLSAEPDPGELALGAERARGLRRLAADLRAAEARESDARARREIEVFVARQRTRARVLALVVLAAAPVVAAFSPGAGWGVGLAGGALLALTLLPRGQGRSYRGARAELDGAQGFREALAREHAQELDALADFLAAHGVPKPSDAVAAEAAVADLARRMRELGASRERLGSETARVARLEQMLEHNARRTEALWSAVALEPGDEPELVRRLCSRERHRGLASDAERLALTVRDIAARLDPRLLTCTPEALEAQIAAAESLRAAHTALARESGALENEVGQARRGHALERALAEAAAAREALARRREEALAAAAGRFWLAELASETDVECRPRLLARAQSLFARFTHHRYTLKLTDEAASFRAVEVETGAGRSLAELSDATRVQLLLAARLAYVEQVDPHAALPLVLDEVLATSDPERFEAVASALLPLAAEHGRQVLYASADPADRVRFERVLRAAGLPEASSVDLDELRGLGRSIGGRPALEVPPLPDVPAPGTLAAEDYGELLRVPAVDPRRPVANLHLFHLLRDDLPLLHALLRERIATVGQWRLLASSGGAARVVGGAAERISALADLAEELFRAWRVGRGRPVDAFVLRRAGLGETWIARLATLLEEVEGDAAKLLERLERRDDERTRNFQSRVRERLREHLLAEGYLDEREPLDEPALHARVRCAVEPHVDAGRLRAASVPVKVHELVHQGRVHIEGRKL